MADASKSPTDCAEKGTWTPVPASVPQGTSLSLKTIDRAEDKSISSSGKMSFHMMACSGNYGDATNTTAVAAAMTKQGGASFLYHLGDITYVEPKVFTRSSEKWEGARVLNCCECERLSSIPDVSERGLRFRA
jgi:hypothetical protein